MKGDPVENQTLFNVLFGVIGSAGAWWLKEIWGMVRAQQTEISQLHIELAKNYVPRAELAETLNRIFTKLDEIQKELKK